MGSYGLYIFNNLLVVSKKQLVDKIRMHIRGVLRSQIVGRKHHDIHVILVVIEGFSELFYGQLHIQLVQLVHIFRLQNAQHGSVGKSPYKTDGNGIPV